MILNLLCISVALNLVFFFAYYINLGTIEEQNDLIKHMMNQLGIRS